MKNRILILKKSNRKEIVQREHLAPSIPLSYLTNYIKSLKSHLKAPYICFFFYFLKRFRKKIRFSVMSIQTQHSISLFLYMSSVPIVYRKGDVIFKIDIKYISGERQESRGKHQRIGSFHSCGHNPPNILVL